MEVCPWAPLSISLQPWLGSVVAVIGGVGVVSNIALVTWLVFGALATSLPHVSLLLLVSCGVAGLGRALLAGCPFTVPALFAGGWIFGPGCCQLFAALGHLFFSAQLVCLTALAHERCAEAEACRARGRGLSTKRPSSQPHVVAAICWAVGVVWAVPPLLGFGNYTCDVSHTSCDLDWRFVSPLNTIYNLLFAILGVLLPIILIVMWLSRALISAIQAGKEEPWDPDYVQGQQTKAMIAITSTLIITWIPKTSLALWTAFGFPDDLYIQIRLDRRLISTVVLTSELSTCIIPAVLFLFDYCVRGSLVRLWRYHQQNNEC